MNGHSQGLKVARWTVAMTNGEAIPVIMWSFPVCKEHPPKMTWSIGEYSPVSLQVVWPLLKLLLVYQTILFVLMSVVISWNSLQIVQVSPKSLLFYYLEAIWFGNVLPQDFFLLYHYRYTNNSLLYFSFAFPWNILGHTKKQPLKIFADASRNSVCILKKTLYLFSNGCKSD